MVLYTILPIALMCQGFLWLSMATLQHDLEQQSRTDVLTGLLNRRALRDVALREIGSARRRNQPLAVILLDLDHFKSINDRHGHDGGDSALCLTAACLVANLRPIDRIARMGGEEFVALLPEADDRQGVLVAERIRSHIERLGTEHPGTCAPLSASFGITCLQPADTTPEELLKRADQALYAAKNSGRNCVSVL
jgi:diguanylate cyclase (GGDEF)-like protein